jgi:hypothetical protein
MTYDIPVNCNIIYIYIPKQKKQLFPYRSKLILTNSRKQTKTSDVVYLFPTIIYMQVAAQ